MTSSSWGPPPQASVLSIARGGGPINFGETIMIRFNSLHFWLAFLGVFATSAMLVTSLMR
jgi:hypothetical protein